MILSPIVCLLCTSFSLSSVPVRLAVAINPPSLSRLAAGDERTEASPPCSCCDRDVRKFSTLESSMLFSSTQSWYAL